MVRVTTSKLENNSDGPYGLRETKNEIAVILIAASISLTGLFQFKKVYYFGPFLSCLVPWVCVRPTCLRPSLAIDPSFFIFLCIVIRTTKYFILPNFFLTTFPSLFPINLLNIGFNRNFLNIWFQLNIPIFGWERMCFKLFLSKTSLKSDFNPTD